MKMSCTVYKDTIRIVIFDCDNPVAKTITKDHKNYAEIFKEVNSYNGKKSSIENIVSLIEDVKKIKSSKLKIEETADGFTFDGITVSEILYDHMLKAKNDYQLLALKAFAKNVQSIPDDYVDASGIKRENPWAGITRSRLFEFVNKFGYAITDDGCFLGLKTVRSDFGSNYDSGKTKNIPGTIVSMNRWECDHNPNTHCSRGLHVRNDAYEYGFGSRTVVIVKVNPVDVVSLPNDYKVDKMRVCKYEVLMKVVNDEVLKNSYFSNSDGTKIEKHEKTFKEDDTSAYNELMKKAKSIKSEKVLKSEIDQKNKEIDFFIKKLGSRKISKIPVIDQMIKWDFYDSDVDHDDLTVTQVISDLKLLKL